MNFLSYLLPALLMFAMGNVQSWLRPLLISLSFPSWIYDSFGFYAILFVAAGILNSMLVKFFTPKSVEEKELKDLRRKDKRSSNSLRKAIDKAVAESEKKLKAEHASSLREQQRGFDHALRERKSECTDLQRLIKAKDDLIDGLTKQLAEKIGVIENYNQSTSSNFNNAEHLAKPTSNVLIPDISGY